MKSTAGGPGRVSVIMPAFNAAGTIHGALLSALRQTKPADEIIVVDDGSTDATRRIVADIEHTDSRVRLISQANAGPSAARNVAVAASTGSLLAPLDADDLWHPEYLEATTGSLERSGEDTGFAYTLHRVIDHDGTVIRDGGDFGIAGYCLHRHLLTNFVGNGSSAVFRRNTLLAAGEYQPPSQAWGGAEDYLLQLRIAARFEVARVGRFLVGYRRSPESYSSRAASTTEARLAAVRSVIRDEGLRLPSLERWIESDAERVAAMMDLQGGSWWPGLRRWARGFRSDPAAAVMDGLLRSRNALSRLGGRRERVGFDAISPDLPYTTTRDSVTAWRLERLAKLDLQTGEARKRSVTGVTPKQSR